ncbi:MAG TPA: hypothetical protein VIN10_05410 [Bacteroidales bacterium]
MKTLNKIKYLLVIIFTVFAMNIFAQGGPGDPGGDPEGGGGGGPLGGGSPISGGTIILTAFGLGYGGLKIYQMAKPKPKETI